MSKNKKQIVWHAYHAGSLCQLVDLEARRADIERIKPFHELPTRQRLMRPVVGQLPEKFIAACEAWDATWDARDATWETRDAAWETWEAIRETRDAAREAWDAAYAQYKVKIETLHATECPDCPWDGNTIFPEWCW